MTSPSPTPTGLPREALIHDLAIVLAGSLHPGAWIGPAPRLAARRLRDVLGIGDGDPVYGYQPGTVKSIEALLCAALTSPSELDPEADRMAAEDRRSER